MWTKPPLEDRPVRAEVAIGALVFVFLLQFQLLRSITIDAYSLQQTRLDLLGFLICQALGLGYFLSLFNRRGMNVPALVSSLVLILYILFIATLTSTSTAPISLLLSRYGILTWFLLGVGFAGVIGTIELYGRSSSLRPLRRLFMLGITIISACSTIFALGYLSLPVLTLSYQAAANNTIIFLLLAMLSMQAMWQSGGPIPVSFAFIVPGTILVAAVILMQSTSIVAFWLAALTIFLVHEFTSASISKRLSLAALLFVAVIIVSRTQYFDQVVRGTRFDTYFAGLGGLSSVDSRLLILRSFWDQFSVSPLFGHFEAEIISNKGIGNFVHSLFLSFLTHTGLLGTVLAILSVGLSLKGRLGKLRGGGSAELHGRLMLVVLFLGTLYTFLTWSVFWFLLGFLCKRAAPVGFAK